MLKIPKYRKRTDSRTSRPRGCVLLQLHAVRLIFSTIMCPLQRAARSIAAALAVSLLLRCGPTATRTGRRSTMPPITFADASSIRRPGASSRRTTSNGNGNGNGGPAKTTARLPAHCRPNRFVSASPLCAAAACRDGVVLAALHTSPAVEPLLLVEEEDGVQDDGGKEKKEDGTNGSKEEEEEGGVDVDDGISSAVLPAAVSVEHLPRAYRGPFRVAPVDGCGTTLLTAGWRADCQTLAAQCRALAAEEAAQYYIGVYGDMAPSEDYAAGIAAEASLWLARCALSGGTRSRNCVGLLASCCRHRHRCCDDDDDDDNDNAAEGRLYLIDAAGVHRVRALAIGRGSDDVNRRLLGVDFAHLGRDEAVQALMEVMLREGGENGDGEHDEYDDGTNTNTEDEDTDVEGDQSSSRNRRQPPAGSRVELAFVDSEQMTRINQRMQ